MFVRSKVRLWQMQRTRHVWTSRRSLDDWVLEPGTVLESVEDPKPVPDDESVAFLCPRGRRWDLFMDECVPLSAIELLAMEAERDR